MDGQKRINIIKGIKVKNCAEAGSEKRQTDRRNCSGYSYEFAMSDQEKPENLIS